MTTNIFEMPNSREAEKIVPLSQESLLCSIESILAARQLRVSVKEKVAKKDYLAAIALLNQLIVCYPNSAIDYNNRGLMHFYLGHFFQAIEDYNRAIALDGKLDNAYNNRANCHAAQGNFLAALSDYEIALDLNPTNLRATINQGITFRELGLYDLALESFETALIMGYRLQGRIYGERGYTYYLRGDWNCASGDYHRALESLPSTDSFRQKVENWQQELLAQTGS
jgi:tetratricopeptide (TPR) repeat protein